MKITSVTVARKFNLGNYEMLSLSAEAELSEQDNPHEVWNILRDNIEMCFTDMQRKKDKPVDTEHHGYRDQTTSPKKMPYQIANENTANPDTSKQGETCPKCGGHKKSGFTLCYLCYEKEKTA